MEQNGRTVTYTPSVGDPLSIQAIVNFEPYGREGFDDGEAIPKRGTVSIFNAATVGVVVPIDDDTLTIDTVVWAIEDIDLGQPGCLHKLFVERFERQEVSDGAHRIRR
jgi:hypothetical protein